MPDRRKRSLASSAGDITEAEKPREHSLKAGTYSTMSEDPMDVIIDEDNISMDLRAHNAMDEVSAQRHLESRPKATEFSKNVSGPELQDSWSASAMPSLERSSDFPLLPVSDIDFSQPVWLGSSVNEVANKKRRAGRTAEALPDNNTALGHLSADSYPSSASHSLSDASVCPSDLMAFGGSHGCPDGKGWDLHGSLYRHDVPFNAKGVASSAPRHNLQDLERRAQSPKQHNLASFSEGHASGRETSRKSRMVLEHVQPDLVERVLSLVLTSDSTIDVKISSQDSSD